MEVGQSVVFKWLGLERIGTLVKINKKETGDEWYSVKDHNLIYPCYKSSKFGYILEDKTKELNQGNYVKTEKNEIDFIMEDIQKSFDKLKELHDLKFPRRKLKETREVIKQMKKQLIDLQKILDNKP